MCTYYRLSNAILASSLALLAVTAVAQEAPSVPPEKRAAATRAFLGLGPEPDKAAAARGAPLFQQSCAFCHGSDARGGEGPSLITSEIVLGDDHGEHLAPFLKKGRPEKGMPSFENVPEDQLRDISEFIHLQIENVANRGTYHVLNILVGDAKKGSEYVQSHCKQCHSDGAFSHIASKFRSPDQLQRGWIWPARSVDPSLSVTAVIRTADHATITGRVTQISDFRITVVGNDGQTHAVDRGPDVDVVVKDPLAPHQAMVMTLKNVDMHNVTAYLETLK
jgi:cytochrome c oxidase cbb3-type subunit III